ncbi:hypothetical protein [Wolbachia endosymbiont (group A) of Pogonocherus hispidulus]
MKVADTGIQEKEWCHPSALTTWIQKKEWCHESSLLLLSSE